MTIQLTIPTLACSSCVQTVTAAIKSVDGDADIQAETKTKLVIVETQVSEAAIRQAIAIAGYPATGSPES